MARIPFTADWAQAGPSLFQWDKKAAYWKGAKGWWASRQGHEGIQGPFRTPTAAQAWAEEPFRLKHRQDQEQAREKAQKAAEAKKARAAATKEREAARAEAQEAKERATWNGLAPEARVLEPGQVWAMKDPRFEGHQILVVEVKKTIAVVLARESKATPWKGLPAETRTRTHIPKVYRLVGGAKVPAVR